MSKHDDRISLQPMLDHAREALDLAQGKSRVDLHAERLLNLGLTRLVEVIGEAATRLSASLRNSHEEIPWAQIIALMNMD